MNNDGIQEPAAPEAPTTEVRMAYAGISTLVATEGTARLALASNLRRDPVKFDAIIKDPLRFREAMAGFYAAVG